ncbi:uncharacterized protein BYT42DRAFT_612337 [Radiomyces spectabilis]|uniref:uncharacterized protein n=1 Tax=Radiomyces spectabilis TaxID=64574 RepID=UPI00221EE1BD|nr:uncharacterized protein BYT42DRAFT_612337 [Radiomyces spectabilis]KAI8384652.1 hypothetical protein BYT42DRAFT_612337 [Radiomyces spectabilis]
MTLGNQLLYQTPHASYEYMSMNPSDEISKHVECLKTRLNFARFKVRNGWEKNTLFDVESLWKQRRRQLINDIPTPRFTQQDIIDKRAYFPSTGARTAKHIKKAKLTRSLSSPASASNEEFSMDTLAMACATIGYKSRNATLRRKSHPPSRSKTIAVDTVTHFPNHSLPQNLSTRQTVPYERKLWHHSAGGKSTFDHDHSSFDAANVPFTTDEEPQVKNSLDFLSYAIAMREERDDHNITQSQPLPEPCSSQEIDIDDQGRMTLSSGDTESEDTMSPPSSPATAAAQAIMMFVNGNQEPIY